MSCKCVSHTFGRAVFILVLISVSFAAVPTKGARSTSTTLSKRAYRPSTTLSKRAYRPSTTLSKRAFLPSTALSKRPYHPSTPPVIPPSPPPSNPLCKSMASFFTLHNLSAACDSQGFFLAGFACYARPPMYSLVLIEKN